MSSRVIILRDQASAAVHDVVRNGDTVVDDAGNPLFVLGVTPRLNLPEYENTSPEDGDIWKWNGKLWTFLDGVLYQIQTSP